MSDKAPKGTRKPPASAWKPGQSGNPKGRPEGSRNRATLAAQALIDGQAEALVKTAVGLALGGDGPMLKVILERLVPARKDAPIKVTLPPMEKASDIPQAMSSILASVAAGELTPTEAQAVAGLVELQRRALETSELEQRIAALEKQGVAK